MKSKRIVDALWLALKSNAIAL